MNRKQAKRKFGTRGKVCSELAAFILWQLRRKGIYQAEIAETVGVSDVMVNRVIWGAKKSARVAEAIAKALGYEDWQTLVQASRGVAA